MFENLTLKEHSYGWLNLGLHFEERRGGKEEIEAVDWYQQRIDVTEDETLKKILEHNRDEEKEHASMPLEWIRRNDETFAKELKENLFQGKIESPDT